MTLLFLCPSPHKALPFSKACARTQVCCKPHAALPAGCAAAVHDRWQQLWVLQPLAAAAEQAADLSGSGIGPLPPLPSQQAGIAAAAAASGWIALGSQACFDSAVAWCSPAAPACLRQQSHVAARPQHTRCDAASP